ncbi:MAG: HU family DNA-binding protein [Rickettsia endosymbiont of Bryobia graminum]|nr:HU family DNA-binding protein [Rickettsia endosymbiont of Bryobia graminum]
MAQKSDLINKISNNLTYLTKDDIKVSVDLIFDYLQAELAKPEPSRIEIRGFGSFSIRQRQYSNSEKSYRSIYYRMPKVQK